MDNTPSPQADIPDDSTDDGTAFGRYIALFARCPAIKDDPVYGHAVLRKLIDLNRLGKIRYDSSAVPGTAIAASDHVFGISIREYCRGKAQCMTELVHEAAHLVYTEQRGVLIKQRLITRQELREERTRKERYHGWDPNEEFFAYRMQLKVYSYLRDQNLIPAEGRLEGRRTKRNDDQDNAALMRLVILDHEKAVSAAAGR